MKRNSDIASLFQKPETKKAAVAAAATSKCSLDPVEPVVEEQTLGRVIWSCCLVCRPSILLAQDIFFEVDEDDILKTFMSLRKRKIKQSKNSIASLWYSFMSIFELFIMYLVDDFNLILEFTKSYYKIYNYY